MASSGVSSRNEGGGFQRTPPRHSHVRNLSLGVIMATGWIKLHRKLEENPIWLSEPFSRGQAWVDLLLIANHKDSHIILNGETIDIKRGQTGRSILTLSKRWKWSRGRTTRFLKSLSSSGQITLKTHTKNSIVTICNYETYQVHDTTSDTTNGTTNGTTSDTTSDTQTRMNKNDKNQSSYLDDDLTDDLIKYSGLKKQEAEDFIKNQGCDYTQDQIREILDRCGQVSNIKSPMSYLTGALKKAYPPMEKPKPVPEEDSMSAIAFRVRKLGQSHPGDERKLEDYEEKIGKIYNPNTLKFENKEAEDAK